MAVRSVLPLGDGRLFLPSSPVSPAGVPALGAVVQDLRDTLFDFRARYHAGRAIAAPQIGVPKRLVYLDVPTPRVLFNPELSGFSPQMMEVWDDCLCFPDLLVRVLRHRSCVLTYRDSAWVEHTLAAEGPLSELLQHEVDHLDGVLAVVRAMDPRAFALRGQRTAGIVEDGPDAAGAPGLDLH